VKTQNLEVLRGAHKSGAIHFLNAIINTYTCIVRIHISQIVSGMQGASRGPSNLPILARCPFDYFIKSNGSNVKEGK
jgi:hypothetical protein